MREAVFAGGVSVSGAMELESFVDSGLCKVDPHLLSRLNSVELI